MLAVLIAGTLPLAGCDGFPWDKKPQPQIEQVTALGGPSVTRGRPATSQPATKAKTKPKVKKAPTNPPPAAPGQTVPGPEIAAAPGQPATPSSADSVSTQTNPDQAQTDQTAPDQASPDQVTGNQPTGDQSTGDQAAGTQPRADQAAGSQVASLPAVEAPDHKTAGQPSEMIGRDENGIRALIGAPTKTRTEGSTTVWSYEKDGCALDLFLFYDVKTGAQRVLSYEIKPSATDSNAMQACYDKFHNV